MNTNRKYLSNYRHMTPLTPDDTLPHTYIHMKTRIHKQNQTQTPLVTSFFTAPLPSLLLWATAANRYQRFEATWPGCRHGPLQLQ